MLFPKLRTPESPLMRYGIAVALTLLALALSLLFKSFILYRTFLFFIPAIVFSAWLGGFGPGMLAAVLTTLLADYFLVEPLHTLLVTPQDFPSYVIFGFIAFLISWLEERRNRTEVALRDLKEELEIILQGAADGITAEDTSGRTVFANQAAATMTGFASPRAMSDTVGADWKPNFEVFDDQGAPVPWSAMPSKRVFQNGQSASLIYRMRFNETGEERWVGVRAAPVFDRNGSVRLVVSNLRDITANRQITLERRKSEERLRKVLNNLTAFVALLTPNGMVVEVNRAALESASMQSEDVLNKPFESLPVWSHSVETQQQLRDMIGRAAKGETVRQDLVLRVGDARYITVDFMIAPVFDTSGGVEYLLPSGIDITDRIQLTQQLIEQSRRLEEIVNSLPGVVYEYIRDPATGKQDMVFASSYAEKMFGYPMERWTQPPSLWDEIVTRDDIETARGQLDQEQATGQPGPVHFRARTQDGRTLHLESYNVRVFNDKNEHVGTRGVVLDITERRRREAEILSLTALIEKQRQRVDLMVASVPGIMFESSPDATGNWRMDFISPYVEKILGYTPDECKTSEFWVKAVHPDDRDNMIRTVVNSPQEGVPPVVQFRCYAKDGRLVYLEAHSGSVLDSQGNRTGVAGVVMDISDRHKDEEAIVQYTDDLRRSNDELEQFAYVASHDLQEPLRMVASYLQLLEQRYHAQFDDDAKTFIGFAVDGATRMKTLINDLLAYSRVQRNRSNFERVEMEQVMAQVVYNLQLDIEDQNATLTHDPLPEITANEGLMVQLLQNMVGNALKFRREVPPKIHIGVQRLDHAWQFSVEDNGIGIAADFLTRIFVIFQRLHPRDKYPGTGIGLAICKKIVENHGGEIRAESQPNQGTTFYFTIPLEMKESLRAYAAIARRGNSAGGR